MIGNLLDLQPNKVTTDLNQYSMVWMGTTGDGKTYSLNKYLKEIAPKGKLPFFIMLEDRYQHIPGIFAQRCHSIPDVMAVVGQLSNPLLREKISCVIIDTADKFEKMINSYTAKNKEVEIVEDIGFSRGKKYVTSKLALATEITNLGLTVHWLAQSYESTDFITKAKIVQTKLAAETKAEIFQGAFLVGVIKPENDSDPFCERLLSFQKTPQFIELKDSFGLPPVVKVSELKSAIESTFEKFDASEKTDGRTFSTVVEEETFESIKEKGLELGGLLAQNGLLNEAAHILKTNIGTNADGTAKMFDSLVEAQFDLAKAVVMQLEDLTKKHNLA